MWGKIRITVYKWNCKLLFLRSKRLWFFSRRYLLFLWVMLNLEQDISIVLNICLIFLFKQWRDSKKTSEKSNVIIPASNAFWGQKAVCWDNPKPLKVSGVHLTSFAFVVSQWRCLPVDNILFHQVTTRKVTVPEGDAPSGYITEPNRDRAVLSAKPVL